MNQMDTTTGLTQPLIHHVLNGGYVRLVDWMGSDLSIVRSARVSYDANWREPEGEEAVGKDAKLIHYLMKNHHTSPFESVTFTFEVKAPIFVFRQWHRHRTWCMAGSTPLLFNRPVDGRPYRLSLEDVVRKWNPPEAKRRRYDQSPLSLEEHNRKRLSSMNMRSPNGDVHLMDAWFSGEKEVYRVFTDYGEVTVSAQHLFKTPTGSSKIENGLNEIMAMISVGKKRENTFPEYSSYEIKQEKWAEISDGYEVSNLGRVRSYWGQGKKSKQYKPFIKKQTINSQGRPVVSIKNIIFYVSRLVAEAFMGKSDDCILHVNYNPLDNRLCNLYYGSPQDNSNDQYVNGGRKYLHEVPVKVKSITKMGRQPTFDITVSGDHWFVADNLVVHNSYNETSARYTELDMGWYVPELDQITTQHTDNKQMRTKTIHPHAVEIQAEIDNVCSRAFRAYKRMLDDGCPRELARSVLPVAAYSKMFATVNLHNLLNNFITLRDHDHAQHEVRVYAQAMKELIKPIVPVTVAAFDEIRNPPQVVVPVENLHLRSVNTI